MMRMILTACLSLMMISAGIAIAQNTPQDNSDQTVETVTFSEQEIDQMLAPIALYPDTVLAHILIAATYPLEVVQAARWTERHPNIEGDDALNAVEEEDWDPSVKALVPFPELIQRMSEELDWTQRLGDAFLDDEEIITSRIQNLRQKAYAEGSLDSLEHLKVVKEQETIVIEPTVREVVYVPYYDTRYVYGSWWWNAYPPVHWYNPHHSYASFYWGPRVYLTGGFFFSGFHWHNHHVVVINRSHHRHNKYYSSREVVRHNDSRPWIHNPQHRRGVDYLNPRTRDHFKQKRARNERQVSATKVQRNPSKSPSQSRKNQDVRVSQVSDGRKNDNALHNSRADNLRADKKFRNADHVRNKSKAKDNNSLSSSIKRKPAAYKKEMATREKNSSVIRAEKKPNPINRKNAKLNVQKNAAAVSVYAKQANARSPNFKKYKFKNKQPLLEKSRR
jgi:Protein of unknown function (DUF3300)